MGNSKINRMLTIYAREGVEIERSSMADWVGGASRMLRLVVEELKDYEKLHGRLFGLCSG